MVVIENQHHVLTSFMVMGNGFISFMFHFQPTYVVAINHSRNTVKL